MDSYAHGVIIKDSSFSSSPSYTIDVDVDMSQPVRRRPEEYMKIGGGGREMLDLVDTVWWGGGRRRRGGLGVAIVGGGDEGEGRGGAV